MTTTTPEAQQAGITDPEDSRFAAMCSYCSKPVAAVCDGEIRKGVPCRRRMCEGHAQALDGGHRCKEHEQG